MCRCQSNNLFATIVFSANVFACGIIDLRPVTVIVYPGAAYTVLPTRDAKLSVVFSAEPVRVEAERAFSVRSQAGNVEGDFYWESRGFTWAPLAPLDPGTRYRIKLEGSVSTIDGREARPEIDIPFFVVRFAAPPRLMAFTPLDGESAPVTGGGTAVVVAQFSEAMDPRTVREAFSLRPMAALEMSWNADGTVVSVIPDEHLSPCTTYSWTLSTKACAMDGAPIPETVEASFITDADHTVPFVERTYPVVYSGGAWVDAGSDLSEVDYDCSLAVLFSEPVLGHSVVSAVRIEPSQPGTVDHVEPRLIVYTPDQGWEPEKTLTLVVTPDIEDMSGLCMMDEYRQRFTPVVPFLELLQVETGSGESSADMDGSDKIGVTIDGPDGLLLLTLGFSSNFDAQHKVAAVDHISLSVFFPTTLPSPTIKSVSWNSDDNVSITWEGLEESDADGKIGRAHV